MLNTIDYIFQREHKKDYFVDLFTGGFSVASFALQRSGFKVIANDLNKYVIALYREILSGGKNLEEVKYNWVSREHFEIVRDNPEMFDDWFVGYILNVWSFGCNQKDYLYGKDLEDLKMALHNALVFNDFGTMKSWPLFDGFQPKTTITEVDFKKHPTNKRIAFMNHFKKFIKSQKETFQGTYDELRRLEQLEHLSQMLHLDAIKRDISFQDRLLLFDRDWKELYDHLEEQGILRNAVIYCDPPYENTKQYQFGSDFDYDAFWNWFRTCPHSVYVSSYTAPKDIKPINFTKKQVNLDNGNRSNNRKTKKKKSTENIYWNGKGDPEPTFLDMLFNQDEAKE